MLVFKDKILRRWVQAAVYFLSSGVSFYGMVYGTGQGFSPRLIAVLMCIIVGLFVAAFWKMLLGVRESVRVQQAAASFIPVPFTSPSVPVAPVAPAEVNGSLLPAPAPVGGESQPFHERRGHVETVPEIVTLAPNGRKNNG